MIFFSIRRRKYIKNPKLELIHPNKAFTICIYRLTAKLEIVYKTPHIMIALPRYWANKTQVNKSSVFVKKLARQSRWIKKDLLVGGIYGTAKLDDKRRLFNFSSLFYQQSKTFNRLWKMTFNHMFLNVASRSCERRNSTFNIYNLN